MRSVYPFDQEVKQGREVRYLPKLNKKQWPRLTLPVLSSTSLSWRERKTEEANEEGPLLRTGLLLITC